ncbi:biopolymer transporter Tol, partial [Xenorhabdus bovienii]|nr:biopolymer transporter Tol [Xenorhabdus bovienii]
IQITHRSDNIQSAFSWDSRGRFIACVCDNSVVLCDSQNGEIRRLTQRTEDAPSADAIVISPDDRYVAFMRDIEGYRQIFVVETGMDSAYC